MTSIYLVRHAESEMNLRAADVVMGRSNQTPLTRKGEAQARELGWFMARKLPPIDMVQTSPALRARRTLDIALAAQGLIAEPVIEPDLQEISQGIAEGRSRRLIWTPETEARLTADPWNFRQPEGESVNDGADRMLGWLIRTAEAHPQQTIFALSHGFAIRSLAGRIAKWSHERVVNEPTPHTSISRVTVEHSKPTLEYVGLPPSS